MNEPSHTARRFFCRLSYLLPAIVGLTLLIWACTPHLFFVNKGEAHETMSLFTLMKNTWTDCQATLDGTTENTAAAAYFSYIMSAAVVVAWIAIVLFGINALASAVFSLSALGKEPTHPEANAAKRWMKFFCFNRVWLAITLLFPILPALVPVVLAHLYRKIFVYDITVHYFGPPAWIIAILLSVAQFVLFVATLRAQASEHLDMFRLYKARK